MVQTPNTIKVWGSKTLLHDKGSNPFIWRLAFADTAHLKCFFIIDRHPCVHKKITLISISWTFESYLSLWTSIPWKSTIFFLYFCFTNWSLQCYCWSEGHRRFLFEIIISHELDILSHTKNWDPMFLRLIVKLYMVCTIWTFQKFRYIPYEGYGCFHCQQDIIGDF